MLGPPMERRGSDGIGEIMEEMDGDMCQRVSASLQELLLEKCSICRCPEQRPVVIAPHHHRKFPALKQFV